MGQSLVQNYLHIVFSTKHRLQLIRPPFDQKLHGYLGTLCNDLDCPTLSVGGYYDHVHILCKLAKKMNVVELVQKVKAYSSQWMKTLDPSLENFFWQDGYGAFSINPREVDVVINYIKNQHAHHSKKEFKDEFRAFLRQYRVDFDERYVWE